MAKHTNKIGACPLCTRDGQELQNSHYQPAGVYRVLRDETQGNPNPLKLTDKGVIQDSLQLSDYLLCRSCEQRLNRNGESWFLAHCWRRNQFRLASMLDSSSPQLTFPKTRTEIYHAAGIPGLNVLALAYFASSMFWRASVHQWEECKGIDLGPYEERLRRYLMDETEFPADCALLVSIPANPTPFVGLSLVPYGGRKADYHCWKLVVLGVAFHLLVGKQIPRTLRQLCFVWGVGNPICRTDLLEQGVIQDINLKFSLHPQLLTGPKGKA